MKTSIFAFIIIGYFSVQYTVAQTGTSKVSDSVVVELQRTALTKDLVNLHDSITVSIGVMNKLSPDANAQRSSQLREAAKELTLYKDRVKVDIDEVSLTSKNSWTTENVSRIRMNIAANRKEYHRISSSVFKNPVKKS